MSPDATRKPFEDRVREAATQAEDDLRKMVAYLNDEVMPEVRRNGSGALRFVATEMRKLAERMDEANHRTPSPPPPPPPAG